MRLHNRWSSPLAVGSGYDFQSIAIIHGENCTTDNVLIQNTTKHPEPSSGSGWWAGFLDVGLTDLAHPAEMVATESINTVALQR